MNDSVNSAGGRREWRMVGADGYWSLLLTAVAVLGTAGLSMIPALVYVLRIAVGTPASAPAAAWLLVFGHALHEGKADGVYLPRLQRARQWLLENPQGRALIMGGFTTTPNISEAAAGRDYLLAHGIEAGQLLLEERSRHTLENLQHARELLRQQPTTQATAPILLSSRYHLARIHVLARGMGIHHQLCAAEDTLPLNARKAGRLLGEAFYILWYWVGRGWAHLWARITGSQHSINRIR